MKNNKVAQHIALVILIAFLSLHCGANLREETLSIAVINEAYSYNLSAEDNSWRLYGSSDLLFSQVRGALPEGIVLSADGTLIGTPEEVGNFEFKIKVYAIDDDWDSDWYYDDDDDDDVSTDAEWYTLFVTEPSTNEACPLPNNESTTGLYLCLGDIYLDSMAQDEYFYLDLNYFINFEKAEDYDVITLEFDVEYNADFFTVDPEQLNSLLLREAATRTNATVSFDTDNPGRLTITVTGVDKSFHKSGRFMDLPFIATQNIPEGSYDFALTLIDVISEHDDVTLPSDYAIDGLVTVEDSIEEEVEAAAEEALVEEE